MTSQDSLQEDVTPSESRPEQRTVLAVTSHRPAEVMESVAGFDGETSVVTVDDSKGRLRRAIETFLAVRDAIRSDDPDLVLLDCFELTGAVATALCRRNDVPVVARIVGDPWRGFENAIPASITSIEDFERYVLYSSCLRLDDAIFDRASGFVTVSRELKTSVAGRTGVDPDRIGVVPVPITTDTTQGSSSAARESLGIGQQQVVLTVTNLSFRAKFRGVRAVVLELQQLLQEDENLAYVVAGDGRYHGALLDELDERIDDPDVRDRIYAPGFVDDVADLYALADVFAYVSYRDGYPNAVLEAQTARLPVVANAAHGMREQITDGETGYLIDPSRPGALRERVATLLANPSERTRMGRLARERVMRENTPEAIGPQLEAFLVELLSIETTER